jgi:hypothetical protein
VAGDRGATEPVPSSRPATLLEAPVRAPEPGSSWLPVGVYLATRAGILLTAVVTGALAHQGLSTELSNWDGYWYLRMERIWFPHTVTAHQTTLGFFPLYSMVIWLLNHALALPPVAAGVIVSGAGGLVAVLLLQRLVAAWKGPAVARRAAVLFSLFPGSVVFSMVYAEGLLLPLLIGCLLALERRRYLLAGLLAAVASAVEADALVLVVVCLVAAVLEIRRTGWQSPLSRRSVAAVAMSPLGAVAFALFLWGWAHTPFATLDVQRMAWRETSSPIARLQEIPRLAREIHHGLRARHNWLQFNQISDLVGTVYLFVSGAVLLRSRWRPPATAIALCAGIAALTLTSHGTAPNPRMLLTAFPLVVVWAWSASRRGVIAVGCVFAVLLVLLSALSFVPVSLRP